MSFQTCASQGICVLSPLSVNIMLLFSFWSKIVSCWNQHPVAERAAPLSTLLFWTAISALPVLSGPGEVDGEHLQTVLASSVPKLDLKKKHTCIHLHSWKSINGNKFTMEHFKMWIMGLDAHDFFKKNCFFCAGNWIDDVWWLFQGFLSFIYGVICFPPQWLTTGCKNITKFMRIPVFSLALLCVCAKKKKKKSAM